MRKTLIATALTATTLALAACGPDTGWSKKEFNDDVLAVDKANCEWELTHEQLPDGTYKVVEVEDEALEQGIRECLEAKGYVWGPLED